MASARFIWVIIHGGLILIGTMMCFLGGEASSIWTKVLLPGIGTSLAATGVAGLLVLAYMRFHEGRMELIRVLEKTGIVGFFETRGSPIKKHYDKRLERASQNIDIMGFGFKALREDYREQFGEWARRAQVRILLLDPGFPSPDYSYAKQRDQEEGNSLGAISGDVEAFIVECKKQVEASAVDPNRFEIRLFRCLPSVNVFRIDGDIFWGPYLMGKQSRNSPTMVVRSDSHLFKCLTAHFDSVWKDHSYAIDLRTAS